METLKKFLTSFSVCALVLLSVAVVPASAASFTDTAGHWGESYVETLVDLGYVSTDHDTYRPDDNLNRAELAKLIVEAVGGVIPDVADTPTFPDVAADAWFYDYVETAYALGIINGYADGNFGPSDNVTREQAVKMIVEGFQVPTTLDPSEDFSDVSSSDWSVDYITTAANQCIVNGYADGTFKPQNNVTRAEIAKMVVKALDYGCDVVEPTPECAEDTDCAEGEVCTDGACEVAPVACTEDADCAADEFCNAEGYCEEEVVAVSEGTLEVSLSADNPAGQTVPKNGTNVPYLVLDFTAGDGEDVEVTNLTVSIAGLGDENSYDEVKIFDGFEQLGSGRSFSSATNQAALNLTTEPIAIDAGTTKTIVVAADMDAAAVAGDENYFSVESVDDVVAYGADTGGTVEVAGDFPLRGNIMTIGTINVGSLDFTEKATTDTSADIGEEQVQITRFEIAADGAEDILVKALTFKQVGTADSDEIANVSLWYGDTQLGETAETVGSNDKVTFDLTGMSDGGWVLEDGTSRTLWIKADIVKGIDKTVTFEIDDTAEDVIAEGLTYGFNVNMGPWDDGTCTFKSDGVTACSGVNSTMVTIQGGDLNFAFTSTSRDVAPDSQDVEFGVLKITNGGEPVTIKDLTLVLTPSAGASAVDIKDIKLVNVDTGETVSGPEDGTTVAINTTENIALGDDFFIDEGETLTLSLSADVKNTVTAGDKYKFTLDVSTVKYKGETSGDDFTCGTGSASCKPATDPSTKEYTVAQATITMIGTTIAAQTYVADAQDVKLWEGTIRANDVEDVVIRQLVFTQDVDMDNDGLEVAGGTTVERDNIAELTLYTKSGSTSTVQEAAVTLKGTTCTTAICGTATFASLDDDGSSGITIPAGEEITVVLRGKVAATLSNALDATDTGVAFTLDVSGTEVENLDGDAATNATVVDITAATQVLVNSGTLKVNLKTADTPDPAIVLAGTENLEVATFEFDSNYEDADVNDLIVLLSGVNTAATLGVADVASDTDAISEVSLYYADGSPVLGTNGSRAYTNAINAGKAKLADLDFQVATDVKEVVSVYVSLNEENTSSGIARSGMTFNAALSFNEGTDDFDIKGLSSGTDYTTVGTLAGGQQIETDVVGAGIEQTNAGENMYVMNNKVTAALASSQPTTLATGTKEALKVTLTPSGDNTAYLGGAKVQVDLTDDDAGAVTALDVTAVDVYSGSKLVASCSNNLVCGPGASTSGVWTLAMCDGTVLANTNCTVADTNNVTIGAAEFDEISASGETYTVKVTAAAVAADDSITAGLKVNTNEATAGVDDYITWRDYGTDGTDGISMDWVDLGSDTSTSTLENTLKK